MSGLRSLLVAAQASDIVLLDSGLRLAGRCRVHRLVLLEPLLGSLVPPEAGGLGLGA